MQNTRRYWQASQDLKLPAIPRNRKKRDKAKYTLAVIAFEPGASKRKALAIDLLAGRHIYMDAALAQRSA